MARRFAVGQISHETNSFSPIKTDLSCFTEGGYYLGEDVYKRQKVAISCMKLQDVGWDPLSLTSLSPFLRTPSGNWLFSAILRASFHSEDLLLNERFQLTIFSVYQSSTTTKYTQPTLSTMNLVISIPQYSFGRSAQMCIRDRSCGQHQLVSRSRTCWVLDGRDIGFPRTFQLRSFWLAPC